MEQVLTRICEKDDLEFVLNGKREIIVEVEGGDHFDEEHQKALTEEGIKEKSILMALVKGERVGFIWFRVSEKTPFGVNYGNWGNTFLWVSFVFVSKEHRGAGIGKLLFAEIEKLAKEKGINEIMLDVYLNNPKSMKFHEGLGFKPFLQLYSKKLK